VRNSQDQLFNGQFPRHATAIALMTLDLPTPGAAPHSPFADKLLVSAVLITHHIGSDGRLLQLRTSISNVDSDSTIYDWLERVAPASH
jgi:hypothetical protein